MLENFDKPRWLSILTDMVRPGGVALMFLFITLLPLVFAMLEVAFEGIGLRLASVLAGYFKAVPDIYYNTLQIMFGLYVGGKSAEVISGNIAKKKDIKVTGENQDVTVNQGAAFPDANS